MKYLRLFVQIVLILIMLLIGFIFIFQYKLLNTVKYSDLYTDIDVDFILANDREENVISIYSTFEYYIDSFKIKDKFDEDYTIQYLDSDEAIYMYISDKTHEGVYFIYYDDLNSIHKLFYTKNKLNYDIQYLNFRDYVIFFDNNGKLSLLRFKDTAFYQVDFNIDSTTVTKDENYSYSFKANEIKYCFTGEATDGICPEVIVNDPMYRGKYILDNHGYVKVYDYDRKQYYDQDFNMSRYRPVDNIFITNNDNLFFIQGTKSKKLLIPSIVVVSPRESTNAPLEEVKATYTRSKKAINESIYIGSFLYCMSGGVDFDGVTTSTCFTPSTGESMYSVDSIDLNYFHHGTIVKLIFKNLYVMGIVLLLIELFLIFLILKCNKVLSDK